MTSRERMRSLLEGRPTDRPPWAVWRHLPAHEGRAGFAHAQVADWMAAGCDVGKINLPSTFCLEDYGLVARQAGDRFGRPQISVRPVRDARDWEGLEPLDPRAGQLGRASREVAEILQLAPPDLPVWIPVFSPLSQMMALSGADALGCHFLDDPSAVFQGLDAVAGSTARWMDAMAAGKPAGWYFVVKENPSSGLSPALLDAGDAVNRTLVAGRANGLDAVHLHGPAADVARHLDFPAAVLHWNERETGFLLSEGARRFPGIVSGGLEWPEHSAEPGAVAALARECLRQNASVPRWMMAPGCVIPCATSHLALQAVRMAVLTCRDEGSGRCC